jgi:hypothetical protein
VPDLVEIQLVILTTCQFTLNPELHDAIRPAQRFEALKNEIGDGMIDSI